MSAVKLPLDLTQIPPFRNLATALGGVGAAHTLWWELWRELGYHAEEGYALGRLPGEAVLGFTAALGEQGLAGEAAWGLLLSSKLLLVEGSDYFCPRFAILNGDLRAVKRESLGGNMKKFHGSQRKAEVNLFQQTLLISGDKFKDAEGVALDPEETRRVTKLIIGCDNALFKNERPSPGFTEGIIQDALAVARRFTDDEINQVLIDVARKRTHPFLNGITTERLLPQFRDMASKLQ